MIECALNAVHEVEELGQEMICLFRWGLVVILEKFMATSELKPT